MSIFNKVAMQKPRFNTFDLSHERKFNTGFGMLTPCFVAEAVPNDTFQVSTSQLVRVAPMVAPVMHRMSVYTHFFFVPNRILWKGWEKFINGGYQGADAPTFPFLRLNGSAEGFLMDYMGLPNWAAFDVDVSAIPFAAYQKIWYEYFRDQNLEAEIAWLEPDGDGLDDGEQNVTIEGDCSTQRYRAWMHDYFTSALPWTQRGVEATIPLGTTADINYVNNTGVGTQLRDPATGNPYVLGTSYQFTTDTGGEFQADAATNFDIQIDPSADMEVDLSTATAASINDLRRAFRLQEWLELNARAGARYNETIMAHFGISPGDARLQRPQYLGGASAPIVISEVLQTSSTSAEPTPQGNLAGHGVSIGGKNMFKYTCKEHGYIIGVLSIMPKSSYQQGIPKHFTKFDKFDYFWKSFANIGEQAIQNQELYLANDGQNANTFGYTPRYAEYKYINDSVHGAFKSSLDFWHAGRIFSSRPTLSTSFVRLTPSELDRIFAVSSLNKEQFYIQMHHKVKARRPMPYFGTPTL